MTDLRLERLNQNVLSMLDLEDLISDDLNGLDPQILAALPNGFGAMIDAHREELLGYLRSAGVDPGVTRRTASAVGARPFTGVVGAAGPRSATVAALFAELSYAAVGYAALFELSLKPSTKIFAISHPATCRRTGTQPFPLPPICLALLPTSWPRTISNANVFVRCAAWELAVASRWGARKQPVLHLPVRLLRPRAGSSWNLPDQGASSPRLE